MDLATVYLNGNFIAATEAKVSVFDRGFLFGDGVYEVIPVYQGKPFRLIEHLSRLEKSLQAINLTADVNCNGLNAVMLELLRINGATNGDYAIYVQVTRGNAAERSFYCPSSVQPTIFAYVKAIVPYTYEMLRAGKSAITLPDIRWQLCHIKSISLLPSVMLYGQVRAAGCEEGILLRDGNVIEGVSSNVFVVKDGMVCTPELSHHNLGGVTRELVLDLLYRHKIMVAEKPIDLKALFVADEVWITSSTRGIVPVVTIDNKSISSGKPGALWEQAIKWYFEVLYK